MNLQPREYSPDLFATNNARLYKHVIDMKTEYCVYILGNSYETPIVKRHRLVGSNYNISFYSEENNQKLSLVMVRYTSNGKSMVLSAVPAYCTHQVGSLGHVESFTPIATGAYKPISDPDKFLEVHKEHTALHFIDKVMQSEAYKKLEAHSKALGEEGVGTEGFTKHSAIENFLSKFRNGMIRDILDIMDRATNATYQAMIKPRTNIWLCFNFTATDHTQTKTYRLLSELRTSAEFQELLLGYFDRRQAVVGENKGDYNL